MPRKPKSKDLQDEAALDEAYFQLTGRKPTTGISRSSLVIIAVCSVLVITAVALVAFALLGKTRTLGNAEIAGISLAGKTKAQAKEELQELADFYASTPMTVTVMDETLVITPEISGARLDVDAILDAAATVTADAPLQRLDIVQYLGLSDGKIWQLLSPLEDRYGVAPSKTQWRVTGKSPDPQDPGDTGSKKLIVTMGVPDYGLDTDKLYQMILQGYRSQQLTITMDCAVQEPELPDLDEIYALICTDAQDAVLDEATFQITPERHGYGFDMAQARILLENCQHGQTVEILFAPILPQVTAEQLEQELYGSILGQCRTPHTAESDRNENLRLACAAINGMTLLPGQTFSYNEALGERTEAKGYKPAASYVNGLTVDTVGGGICQVSSTLYYSCLLADMQIVRRSPHGYVSSYIPKGMDAAVSWKSQDFKFKNNLSTPIRLRAWMEDGYVNVVIYGKETRGYYVELVYEELSTEPFDTVYRELPANNPEGYTDGEIIITPYTGCTVKTYKKLYDRQTQKLLETVFETQSTYRKRDKVICLIVEPTTPAPTETIPETTPVPAETTPTAPDATPNS